MCLCGFRHDCFKKWRIRSPNQQTHAEHAGVPQSLLRRVRWRLFSYLYFLTHLNRSESQWLTWPRVRPTPRKPICTTISEVRTCLTADAAVFSRKAQFWEHSPQVDRSLDVLISFPPIHGGVAQSVEQAAHIRSVRGSSPFATKQYRSRERLRSFLEPRHDNLERGAVLPGVPRDHSQGRPGSPTQTTCSRGFDPGTSTLAKRLISILLRPTPGPWTREVRDYRTRAHMMIGPRASATAGL